MRHVRRLVIAVVLHLQVKLLRVSRYWRHAPARDTMQILTICILHVSPHPGACSLSHGLRDTAVMPGTAARRLTTALLMRSA